MKRKFNLGAFLKKLPLIVLGFAFAALGLAVMIRSRLGMGPWGALEVGVSNRTGLSVGTVTQIISLILVIVSWVLAVRPTLVTLLNVFLIGFFMDIALRFVPQAEGWVGRGAFFLIGLGLYSFGIAFYLSAARGDSGPRESLMLAVSRAFRASIRVSRISVDIFALALALIARGPIGVGTVVFAVSAGPIIQFFLRLLGHATKGGLLKNGAGGDDQPPGEEATTSHG